MVTKRPEKNALKDSFKVSLKTLQIEPISLKIEAIDFNLWSNTLHNAAIHAEERRMADAVTKRHLRNSQTESDTFSPPPVIYVIEGFSCKHQTIQPHKNS
jgi:hypothetical protein